MEQGTRESGGESADDGGGGGGGGGGVSAAAGVAGATAGGSVESNRVRWDQIFPRRSLKVLLVEHDNSTRQVVAALLRKCSYLVMAVDDALKAWEIMQERRYAFDLVLTEVAMPSLSGIGLLTKIVSTEKCKNIPVIMMSSQDSMGVVLKCMLKGASDFLVKPVRKNELKNLWQHVWRKQFSSSQANASENNAASNRSVNVIADDDVSKTGENCENANGAQNSENKQEMEVESAQNFNSNSSQEIQEKQDLNTGTVPVQSDGLLSDKNELERTGTSTTEFNKGPLDLCGTINSKTCDIAIKENGNSNSNCAPLFNKEETLRGKSLISSKSHVIELNLKAKHVLNHSQGSAFARYGANKIQNSNIVNPSSSSSLCFKNTDQNPTSSLQSKEDNTHSYRFIPLPVPIGSVPYGYTTILHPIYYPSSFPPSKDVPAPPVPVPVPTNNDNEKNNNNCKEIVEEDNCRELIQQNGSNGSGDIRNFNNLGTTLESGNESTAQTGDRSRREAALIKFRLKRKDRCFEKKVRYYNRKKLAEQRPRVKGQFVSQKTNQSNNQSEIDG